MVTVTLRPDLIFFLLASFRSLQVINQIISLLLPPTALPHLHPNIHHSPKKAQQSPKYHTRNTINADVLESHPKLLVILSVEQNACLLVQLLFQNPVMPSLGCISFIIFQLCKALSRNGFSGMFFRPSTVYEVFEGYHNNWKYNTLIIVHMLTVHKCTQVVNSNVIVYTLYTKDT